MIGSMRLASWCCLVSLLLGGVAWAQGAVVSGRVVDPQGAAVADARLTLGGLAAPRTIRSAPDGTFRFDAVTPGTYSLTVEAPGFWIENQTVTVAGTVDGLTIGLRIDPVNQDVTVQGALVGTVATGKTTLPVRELPLTIDTVLGREIIDEQGDNDLVTALKNVPGVYAFTTYGVYEYYSFRGFLDSVQLVDGVRNEGNRINTQLTNIERIEVLKGPSSALYGGSALGATVNLIRKKPARRPAYDFSASAGSWSTGARRLRRDRPLGQRRRVVPLRHRRRDQGGISPQRYDPLHRHALAAVARRRHESDQRLLHVQSRSLRRRRRAAADEFRFRRADRRQRAACAARPQLPDAAG